MMEITPLKISSYPAFYVGPSLKEKVPTVFYFAISGKDSLSLAPFNNFVSSLDTNKVRVISLSLPFHGDVGEARSEKWIAPEKALSAWATSFEHGDDIIARFIKEVTAVIHELISSGSIDPDTLAVAGLSRGAFIASWLASTLPFIKTILGFAPLVDLSLVKEFQNASSELITPYNLKKCTELLYNRAIRFYIGNHDERVGTHQSFDFIYACAKKASHHRIRSAPIELIIYPSIGHKGHGTPETVFAAGAKWIENTIT